MRTKRVFTIFNKEGELKKNFLKLAEKFHNIKCPIRTIPSDTMDIIHL